jgi:hypothetical protein
MNTTQFDTLIRTAMIFCIAVGAFAFLPSLFSKVAGGDLIESYTTLAWFWVLGSLGYICYPTEYSQQTLQDKLIIIAVTSAAGIVLFLIMVLYIVFG